MHKLFWLAVMTLGAGIASAQEPWQPCTLGEADAQLAAECATVTMPLDHDSGAGSIDIAVARVRGEGASLTQVWFLDGGPGDSGINSLPKVARLLAGPGIDVYTLDHRGVGNSALLRCETQQAADSPGGAEILAEEWSACMQAIVTERADLPALTTTASARDVLALIEANRQPGVRVALLGVSYGTYWAQRVLQIDAAAIDAVVLDGIVPPDWTFAEFDAALDRTARALMLTCRDDEGCREHLGEDPVAVAADLPGRFDAGHCPDLNIDGATVRLLLGNMIMGGEEIWPWIPAAVYRLDRCRLRDLLAIGEMFARLFESGDLGAEGPSHSPVLQRHVAMSEMWPQAGPSPEELTAALDGAIATTGVSAAFAKTYAGWPRYARPDGGDGLPDYAGPMLLLHGELDPTMPAARLAALFAHYSAPGQSAIVLSGVGHVGLGDSACAASLVSAFLRDPGAPVATSCAEGGADPLRAPAGASPFGTDDLYGDWPSDLELLAAAVAAALLLAVVAVVFWIRRRRRASRRAPPE